MSPNLTISIILCSYNRAAGLRQALEALGRMNVRPGWKAEVVVAKQFSQYFQLSQPEHEFESDIELFPVE